MAPTACNSQGISYLGIDTPGVLHEITRVTVDWAGQVLGPGSPVAASPYAPHTRSLIEVYRKNGSDVVLRSAPCLVIGIAE